MHHLTLHTLSNGLRVAILPKRNSPLVACNLLYHVGSLHDEVGKRGLAHFFEHLMFGPSQYGVDYDALLERAGGHNNAYTTFDFTNYYATLPLENIEMALYLEAQRMGQLMHDVSTFDTQKKVVIEEFQQTTLNQPYGDAWQLLLGTVYEKHPYAQFPIGRSVEEIEAIQPCDVKKFEKDYYHPANAILTLVGNIEADSLMKKVIHWFDQSSSQHFTPIPFQLPSYTPPPAKLLHHTSVKAAHNRLYQVYPIPARISQEFFYYRLLSNLLGEGKDGWLYKRLVVEKKLCTQVAAYPSNTLYNGVLMLSATLADDISFLELEEEINQLFLMLLKRGITENELKKGKNQIEAEYAFDCMRLSGQAEQLAIAMLLGSSNYFEEELSSITQITADQLNQRLAKLHNSHCYRLHYKKNNNKRSVS